MVELPDSLDLLVFGRGIFHVVYDIRSMAFEVPNKLNNDSPSFGVMSDKQVIYTSEGGSAKAYQWTGANLSQINARGTGGQGATHVGLSPSQTHVGIASFNSGDVAIYSVNENSGALNNDRVQVRRGGNSKPHWVGWSNDGKNMYVVYRDDNLVTRHSFNEQGAGPVGNATVAWRAKAGDGPRHMAFHPNGDFAYIITENTGRVAACTVNADGSLDEFQSISALPAGFRGENKSAHIQISEAGDTLYVSNRGHDSITAFAIDGEGRLSVIEQDQERVARPRAFLLLDNVRLLLVANQDANNVSAMTVGLGGELDYVSKTSNSIPNTRFVLNLPK